MLTSILPVLPRHDPEWHVSSARELGLEALAPIALDRLLESPDPRTLFDAVRGYVDDRLGGFKKVAIACDRLKIAAPLAGHSDVTLYALDRCNRGYRQVLEATWRQEPLLHLPPNGRVVFITNSAEPQPPERRLAYQEEVRECRAKLLAIHPHIQILDFDLAKLSGDPEVQALGLDSVVSDHQADAVFCTNFFLTTTRTLAAMRTPLAGVEIFFHDKIIDLAMGFNYSSKHLSKFLMAIKLKEMASTGE